MNVLKRLWLALTRAPRERERFFARLATLEERIRDMERRIRAADRERRKWSA